MTRWRGCFRHVVFSFLHDPEAFRAFCGEFRAPMMPVVEETEVINREKSVKKKKNKKSKKKNKNKKIEMPEKLYSDDASLLKKEEKPGPSKRTGEGNDVGRDEVHV